MDQGEEFEQLDQDKLFQSFFVEAKEIDGIISSLSQETGDISLQKKTDEIIKIVCSFYLCFILYWLMYQHLCMLASL